MFFSFSQNFLKRIKKCIKIGGKLKGFTLSTTCRPPPTLKKSRFHFFVQIVAQCSETNGSQTTFVVEIFCRKILSPRNLKFCSMNKIIFAYVSEQCVYIGTRNPIWPLLMGVRSAYRCLGNVPKFFDEILFLSRNFKSY